MYWMPKTKIGKISFWICISAFVLLFSQYWLSMLFSNNCVGDLCPDPGGFSILVKVVPGILAIALILITCVTSLIAIVKYHDRAILLFLPVLIGFMGIIFIL